MRNSLYFTFLSTLLSLAFAGSVATAADSPASADSAQAAITSADSVYPGTALRFHPGYYMLIYITSSVASFVDEVADNPYLLGISQRYNWVDLEPSKDNYDFSQIRADIDLLKARDKRLILQLKDASSPSNPFIPVPAYMRTTEYMGGYQGFTDKPGYVSKRWIPAVGDRYRALVRALAAAFKDEPYLEAIKTEETAMDIDKRSGDYSHEAYFDQLKLNIDTLAEAFPNTVTVQYANFLAAGTTYLADLEAYARSKHVGWGGPDLAPQSPSLVDGVYRLYPLHKGYAPLIIDVQAPEYEPRTNGPYHPAEMLEFGLSTLKLDYICWHRITDKWPKVLATITDPAYAGALGP